MKHLRVWFPKDRNRLGTPRHFLRAVEDVSFNLLHGEVLGLVGESGCGKTTVARAISGLQSVESGQVFFEGRNIIHLNDKGWRAQRRGMQLVSGNPLSSLNPRRTIGAALREPLQVHRIVPRAELEREAGRLIELAGLSQDVLWRYPHQLSALQATRAVIARALALRPKLLILDEPLCALNASEGAEIAGLLNALHTDAKLSCLFISSDPTSIRHIADRLLVMEAGSIVERGDAEDVLMKPKHPYTQRMIEAAMLRGAGGAAT